MSHDDDSQLRLTLARTIRARDALLDRICHAQGQKLARIADVIDEWSSYEPDPGPNASALHAIRAILLEGPPVGSSERPPPLASP